MRFLGEQIDQPPGPFHAAIGNAFLGRLGPALGDRLARQVNDGIALGNGGPARDRKHGMAGLEKTLLQPLPDHAARTRDGYVHYRHSMLLT